MSFYSKRNRICRCGNLIKMVEKCPCKNSYRSRASDNHISSTRRFQKLRKQIIRRDNGHCVRCRVKYNEFVGENLQCHHIKSFRDYPELAYEPSNLLMVCRRCNIDLGNNNKLDFKWEAPELETPTL